MLLIGCSSGRDNPLRDNVQMTEDGLITITINEPSIGEFRIFEVRITYGGREGIPFTTRYAFFRPGFENATFSTVDGRTVTLNLGALGADDWSSEQIGNRFVSDEPDTLPAKASAPTSGQLANVQVRMLTNGDGMSTMSTFGWNFPDVRATGWEWTQGPGNTSMMWIIP